MTNNSINSCLLLIRTIFQFVINGFYQSDNLWLCRLTFAFLHFSFAYFYENILFFITFIAAFKGRLVLVVCLVHFVASELILDASVDQVLVWLTLINHPID